MIVINVICSPCLRNAVIGVACPCVQSTVRTVKIASRGLRIRLSVPQHACSLARRVFSNIFPVTHLHVHVVVTVRNTSLYGDPADPAIYSTRRSFLWHNTKAICIDPFQQHGLPLVIFLFVASMSNDLRRGLLIHYCVGPGTAREKRLTRPSQC